MNGIGDDQISYLNNNNETVDVYSGAPILTEDNIPDKPYYLVADDFSVSKLTERQRENLSNLTEDCEIIYSGRELKVYECG